MSITKNDQRQEVIVAYVDFEYDDLVSASQLDAIELPPGAVVIGGYIEIGTAFDSATSDAIDIGDSADDDRYTASAIDAQSTGVTALDVTGHEYTAQDNVTLTWTGAGTAPSAGAGRLVVEYYDTGRSHFTQG